MEAILKEINERLDELGFYPLNKWNMDKTDYRYNLEIETLIKDLNGMKQ